MTTRGNKRDDHKQHDGQHWAALSDRGEHGCHREHLLPLEPEILESFGCAAVQHRGPTLVATAGREVALGDPRGRAV